MNKSRTIQSLALQCIKRYPVPMTAWQIGKLINRNPASTSSRLNRMYNKGLIFKFSSKDNRVLYLTTNIIHTGIKFDQVVAAYSYTNNCDSYNVQKKNVVH